MIKSKELERLGFNKVMDDQDFTDIFYAFALQDLTEPNKMAYTFISDSINEKDEYAVYIIGYGEFSSDVTIPIKDANVLEKIIPVYLKKVVLKSKIFN